MVEDVLIKVEKFIFSIDFVVLDTKRVSNADSHIPVILGCPFLSTSNALINYRNYMMKLCFGNMTVDLDIFNLQRQPNCFNNESFYS